MTRINEIVTLSQNQTMSSLQIAELTGKQHAHILRDIRELLEQGVNQSNFGLVEYTDKKGEKRPCYQLTKTGCYILASGYNAVLREKIINRWIELETDLMNQEFNKHFLHQSPFPVCKSSITIRSQANFLTTYTQTKIGQNKLFELLREWKYLQICESHYNEPYQKYIDRGMFELTVKSNKIVTLVTPKGQRIIAKRYCKSLPGPESYSLF